MPSFVLSRSAELDLDALDLQTIEQFGFDQADRTSEAFLDAMRRLSEMPEIGHTRAELDPPGRTFRYWVLRRFLVVYEPVDTGIRVARIIDATRDLRAVLERELGDT
jgi:plasmid stabilization system protein ParE